MQLGALKSPSSLCALADVGRVSWRRFVQFSCVFLRFEGDIRIGSGVGTKLPFVADQSNGSFRPDLPVGSDVADLVPSAYVGGRSAYAGRKAEPDEAHGRQGARQAVGAIIRGPMIFPAYRDRCSSSSKP